MDTGIHIRLKDSLNVFMEKFTDGRERKQKGIICFPLQNSLVSSSDLAAVVPATLPFASPCFKTKKRGRKGEGLYSSTIAWWAGNTRRRGRLQKILWLSIAHTLPGPYVPQNRDCDGIYGHTLQNYNDTCILLPPV